MKSTAISEYFVLSKVGCSLLSLISILNHRLSFPLPIVDNSRPTYTYPWIKYPYLFLLCFLHSNSFLRTLVCSPTSHLSRDSGPIPKFKNIFIFDHWTYSRLPVGTLRIAWCKAIVSSSVQPSSVFGCLGILSTRRLCLSLLGLDFASFCRFAWPPGFFRATVGILVVEGTLSCTLEVGVAGGSLWATQSEKKRKNYGAKFDLTRSINLRTPQLWFVVRRESRWSNGTWSA